MALAESWERTKCPQTAVRLADQGEPTDRRWLAMVKWCFLGCAALLLGCENTTETGYVPRKLGDSETVQRGYYATPFSPESRAAEAEQKQRFEGFDSGRRPADWRPNPY